MAHTGWYAEYRVALLWAGVFNILGALFASMPLDMGFTLRRLAILSVCFWLATGLYVAVRRKPTVGELVVIGSFPLLLVVLAANLTHWH